MSDEEKPITVVAAIIANLVIAIAKFWAAMVSGSSAMLAEGVHSVVDTGNEALLLIGAKRSKKAADEGHPFGYGKELYFWGLIVAMLLFSVGGGMSIYEGLHRLHEPREGGSLIWNYVVLGVAFVAEGTSLVIAIKAVHEGSDEGTFWQKFHRSKDPTKFLVVGEDTAALLGILLAFAGVSLSHLTKSRYPDAIASMLIGVLLCSVAAYLVYESKNLLIGESTDRSTVKRIAAIANEHSAVRHVGWPATMHLAPDQVILNLDLQFDERLTTTEIAQAIDAIEETIRNEFPEIKRIFLEAQLFSKPTSGDETQRNAPSVARRAPTA